MNKILLNLPSQIITPRLILRPPRAGDGGSVYKVFADGYEDLIKWLNQPPVMQDREAFEIECRRHAAEWILRNDMRLLLIEKHTNTVVGRASYPPSLSNWEIPYFGISYLIAKGYRGKGYVTESVNAMIRFAFDFLNARKIEIKCDSENIKSLSIPERLGMKLEATQIGIWPSQDKQSLATIKSYAVFNTEDLPPLHIEYI